MQCEMCESGWARGREGRGNAGRMGGRIIEEAGRLGVARHANEMRPAATKWRHQPQHGPVLHPRLPSSGSRRLMYVCIGCWEGRLNSRAPSRPTLFILGRSRPDAGSAAVPAINAIFLHRAPICTARPRDQVRQTRSRPHVSSSACRSSRRVRPLSAAFPGFSGYWPRWLCVDPICLF